MKKSTLLLSTFLLMGCSYSSTSNTVTSNIYKEGELPTAPQEAFQTINNNFSLVSKNYELIFENDNNVYEVHIAKKENHNTLYKTINSIQINIRDKGGLIGYNEKKYTSSYNSITQTSYGYLLSSTISSQKGSKFLIEDAYYILKEDIFALQRKITVIEANPNDYGFASQIRFFEESLSNKYTDFDYFIPSILYKDSSNMPGGAICSNLDLNQVYVKETRMGLPMVMAHNKTNFNTLALTHLNPQISTGSCTSSGLGETNNDIQYGSLGLDITPNVGVGYIYPSSEFPNSYDANGPISRYNEIKKDYYQEYSLSLIASNKQTYNDAMVYSYQQAYQQEARKIYDMDIDEIYKQNIDLFSSEYREYKSNNDIVSAGFPWALDLPDGKNTEGVSFQMGFVGQQIPASYHLFRYGTLNNDQTIAKKGENILDFWSSDKINANYFPYVWWNPSNNTNGGSVHQYSCFLRCMVDGMEGMIDAYIFAKQQNIDKPAWYNMIIKFANNLVNVQNEDGSFYRAYKTSGEVESDTSDYRTQGKSKLNTPIAVRFLGKMYELTNENKYKDAALKASEYCHNEIYQKLCKYVGGTPDNANVVDKEASVYAMYCFNTAYTLSNDEKYLKASEHAAVNALSWTYVYDYAVPNLTDEDKLINPFSSGGVIGFSIIATGHSSADNYSAYTYFETYRLYLLTGNEFYKNAALLLQNNTKLSTDYDGRLGYKYKAMMPEATRVSDFRFTSTNTWLPWSGVANIEPMIDFFDAFSTKDIYKLKDDFNTQKNKIKAYGCGGKLK